MNAVDLHERVIEMLAPARGTHPAYPLLADLRREPHPPEPHRLIAHFDATLMEQVLHVPRREREPDIHHHGQPDDLGAGAEVPKGAALGGVAQPACVLNETTAGQARTSMQAKSEALPPRSRNLVLQGCAYERSDRFSRLTRPDIAQKMVNARSFGAAPRFDDPYGKVRECTPLWALPCSLLRLRGQGSAPLLVELLDISVPLCLPTTLGGLPTEQAQRLLVLDVWRRLAV